jgi:hypothetical protein
MFLVAWYPTPLPPFCVSIDSAGVRQGVPPSDESKRIVSGRTRRHFSAKNAETIESKQDELRRIAKE